MTLSLLGLLIIPWLIYGAAGTDFYYNRELQISTQILPGFYWGLLSIFLIGLKIIIINFADIVRMVKYKIMHKNSLSVRIEKLSLKKIFNGIFIEIRR